MHIVLGGTFVLQMMTSSGGGAIKKSMPANPVSPGNEAKTAEMKPDQKKNMYNIYIYIAIAVLFKKNNNTPTKLVVFPYYQSGGSTASERSDCTAKPTSTHEHMLHENMMQDVFEH